MAVCQTIRLVLIHLLTRTINSAKGLEAFMIQQKLLRDPAATGARAPAALSAPAATSASGETRTGGSPGPLRPPLPPELAPASPASIGVHGGPVSAPAEAGKEVRG